MKGGVVTPVVAGTRARGIATLALAETKRLFTAKVLEIFDRDTTELTALSARLFASAEAREGMTAFLERRDPAWTL